MSSFLRFSFSPPPPAAGDTPCMEQRRLDDAAAADAPQQRGAAQACLSFVRDETLAAPPLQPQPARA